MEILKFCSCYFCSLTFCTVNNMDRDSSVGIATRYGLGGPGGQNPVEASFSAPVHTGPEAHPASCTVVPGLSRGLSGRGVALTTLPHLVPRWRIECSYTSTPPLGLRGLFWGELYLYLYHLQLTLTAHHFNLREQRSSGLLRRIGVISYRRFGTAYRCPFGSWRWDR